MKKTLLATGLLLLAFAGQASENRPNILLVVFEDMSQRVGAYGDPVATTPHLDAFARESLSFRNAFTTAGVCAPSRAALITGVHQQTLGAQHMRTAAYGSHFAPAGFEIGYAAVPPAEVKAFPELLRAAGYYTFTGYGGWPFSNKKDYQFGTPETIWDADSPAAHWSARREGQPFFGMITLITTHESLLFPNPPVRDTALATTVAARSAKLLEGQTPVTRPEDVTVPAWLPDTPAVRQEIARQYDNIAFTEQRLAELQAALERDGLADNTIVIVTTDHGDGFPRAKRTVYDSGIRVPLMIRFPGGAHAGEFSSKLVSFVDLAPTILSLAQAPGPAWLQGRDFLTPGTQGDRRYIFAASDRMDAYMDRVKAVRDKRYKLIRNYQPGLPLLQPVAFREELLSMQAYRAGAAAGTLTPLQSGYLTASRTAYELYDLEVDPEETRNLAGKPGYAVIEQRLRAALEAWIAATPDRSALPERQMVEAMWPGMSQPHTQPPVATLTRTAAGQHVITAGSGTEGASLSWRAAGSGSGRSPWQLYTGPVTLAGAAVVELKAERYGYAPSEVVTVTVTEAGR
jgi:arylsulfatase A-like enzyme